MRLQQLLHKAPGGFHRFFGAADRHLLEDMPAFLIHFQPGVAAGFLQGFGQALADYVHKRKYPIAGPLSTWGLRAATLTTLYGLYEFNTNDIGECSLHGC